MATTDLFDYHYTGGVFIDKARMDCMSIMSVNKWNLLMFRLEWPQWPEKKEGRGYMELRFIFGRL